MAHVPQCFRHTLFAEGETAREENHRLTIQRNIALLLLSIGNWIPKPGQSPVWCRQGPIDGLIPANQGIGESD
jgi:hypothetical protein